MTVDANMHDCPMQPRLDAYHDGELSAEAAGVIARHVTGCELCSRRLGELRRMSRELGSVPAGAEITPAELSRLHRAIGWPDASRLLRLGGFLSTAAASVLIISLAWLAVPRKTAPVVVLPPHEAPWERMAQTLQPPPLRGTRKTGVAVDDTARWMIDSLKQGRKP